MGVKMNIIIGRPSSEMNDFMEKVQEPKMLVKDICKIKFLKDPITIFIPFSNYQKNGFIENTGLFLEEALLMLKVREVIYLKKDNATSLEELCHKYQVKMSQSL